MSEEIPDELRPLLLPAQIPDLPWKIELPFSLASVDSALWQRFDTAFLIYPVHVSSGCHKYAFIDRHSQLRGRLTGFALLLYARKEQTRIVVQSPELAPNLVAPLYRLVMAWVLWLYLDLGVSPTTIGEVTHTDVHDDEAAQVAALFRSTYENEKQRGEVRNQEEWLRKHNFFIDRKTLYRQLNPKLRKKRPK
jgi:hypothetical protein